LIPGLQLKKLNLLPDINYYHISVSDNGMGFEPEFSEKIFEVFQTLNGKDEYPGTGIGLAIVKKIVDNHNGIIRATGHLNKGAIFDLYIPEPG
jgi:signal transduction histidine kinase